MAVLFNSKYFSIATWHSINIIPNMSSVYIYHDDYPHDYYTSMLEINLFGCVMHFYVPHKLPRFSTPLIGPLWSKRKKKWYRIKL